ncbi:hypothetical protein PHET_00394 [Paragonimus heterotremus]|uniref:Uncharacterized protein n=1 Tax=Paragonimus heterotremus TaxID=100268 RepID=A0A8J4SV90_9TREM|nr:hypothetical protein PHET_00394 [Paragonimus heterotremus]
MNADRRPKEKPGCTRDVNEHNVKYCLLPKRYKSHRIKRVRCDRPQVSDSKVSGSITEYRYSVEVSKYSKNG